MSEQAPPSNRLNKGAIWKHKENGKEYVIQICRHLMVKANEGDTWLWAVAYRENWPEDEQGPIDTYVRSQAYFFTRFELVEDNPNGT